MERIEDEVAHHRGANTDHCPANEMNHGAQDSDNSETEQIAHDELEGILRGCAEVRAHQRHLNVCVLVEELDALLNTPDHASENFQDEDHDTVLLCCGLLLKVFAEIPDKLYQCQNKRAKSKCSQVVAERRIDRLADHWILATSLINCEEPLGASKGDDELPESHKERVVPKKRKECSSKFVIECVPWRRTPPAARLDAICVSIDSRASVIVRAVVALVLPHDVCRPFVSTNSRCGLVTPRFLVSSKRF
mmetsp:Transcript_51378/g.96259  ORF Transcript_51378/g.96259 Transcript_51378/m.96259 type:complete len:249 (-) Transcript_51378:81-827(-)